MTVDTGHTDPGDRHVGCDQDRDQRHPCRGGVISGLVTEPGCTDEIGLAG